MKCQVTTLLVCFVLSTALFIVEGGGRPRERCPDGFSTNGQDCYWFSEMTATFAEARSICEHLGSHLAIITSQSQNDFIVSYAQETGHADYYFLGGSQLGQKDSWKWEGGIPWGYTNWGPGQPDDYMGHEDCLSIWKGVDYQWNDDSCNSMKNFICEVQYEEK